MKCDRCENGAAYIKKYSGQALCSICFTKSLARKAAKTVSKYNMIGRGDRVAVGVSGGKDSLVLLHILEQMSQKWGFELEAVTIDEGIPGYRDEALSIVEEYCGSLGVAHRVYAYKDLFDMTLDEALNMRGENSQTSCSICGTLRRRAMDHAIHDTGADVLATAHNLDDTLQTFLINMISGDTDRIAWMDPDTSSNELRKIKPFCEIYESEIVFYAFANKIPFQAESCPHMDEGIRTELRIFLNSLEESHSGAKNSLYRSVMKVTEALRPEVHKERQQCPGCGNSCTGGVCSVCRTISGLRGTAQGEAPGTA